MSKRQFTRELLNEILQRDGATLVGEYENLNSNVQIYYTCNCGTEHGKKFNNLCNGGGAFCNPCSQRVGQKKRIESMKKIPKWNNGIDYNPELAKETAERSGSVLLGIYKKNEDETRVLRILGERTSREDDLLIKCSCGNDEYVNFRYAYDYSAAKCSPCRRAQKSEALRNKRRGVTGGATTTIEHIPERSQRIERDGQTCIECKVHKESTAFHSTYNKIEKCRIYNGKCYECRNKKRTQNKEDKIRNSSIREFLAVELEVARDRVKRYNKDHPTKPRECAITVEQLLDIYYRQDGKCALSGRNMLTNTHRDSCAENLRINPCKLSIDRINSDLGYVEGNVQLCCWQANNMKQDMSCEDFKSWIADLYRISESKP